MAHPSGVTPRQLLLLFGNLVATVVLFCPLLPLLLYLTIGYVLVLHAYVVRERLAGWTRTLSPAIALGFWTLVWFSFRQGWLDRFPSLGLAGTSPNLVGASYLYLKVFDLIRRSQRGQEPPGIVLYLTQMTFFPSFLAGPIAGPEPFANGLAPTRARFGEGLNRLLAGAVKLYVLTPILATGNVLALQNARGMAAGLSWGDFVLSVYASALWMFTNFAGYSDLAIGAGLLMGVKLPENFDSPYLAGNPTEFWQRWHASFSSWLREHVFNPVSRAFVARGLGGSTIALVGSTAATMVACGLWHRVTWSFLVWGLYHAAALVIHQLYATRVKPRLRGVRFLESRAYRVLATVVTFHVVAIGWVLFLPLEAPLEDHLALLGRLAWLS